MRTLSVMAPKTPTAQTLELSPQFGRRSPLGANKREDLRDSIKKMRESELGDSLDKKAKSALRNSNKIKTI